MTNQEIITRGELIRDETVTGANTAQRVGEAFVAIGENLQELDSRQEAIAFTESKEMNAFIKKLFVDISGYSGELELTDLYLQYWSNGSTIQYIALHNAVTGGSRLVYMEISNSRGNFCANVNGIYVYLEYNELTLPTSAISSRAKLTNWAYSYSNDPRKSNLGFTDNPQLNKYISKLWIEFPENYVLPEGYSSLEDVKKDICVYSLGNKINQTSGLFQSRFWFTLGDGQNYIISYSSDNADGIPGGEIDFTTNSGITLHAVVDWVALKGLRFGEVHSHLNTRCFDGNLYHDNAIADIDGRLNEIENYFEGGEFDSFDVVDYTNSFSQGYIVISVGDDIRNASITANSIYRHLFLSISESQIQDGDIIEAYGRNGGSSNFICLIKNNIVVEIYHTPTTGLHFYSLTVDSEIFDTILFNAKTDEPDFYVKRKRPVTIERQPLIEDFDNLKQTVEEMGGESIISKRTLKIVCFGNSFTEDSFSYVPPILKEVAPNLEFTIMLARIGGSPLAQHCANFTGVSQTVEGTTYNVANYSCAVFTNKDTSWQSKSSLTTVDAILNYEDWDIITFQQLSGESYKEWETYFQPFIYKIHQALFTKISSSSSLKTKRLKLGWILTHGKGSSFADSKKQWEGYSYSQGVYPGIINNSKMMLDKSATEIIFPYGTAIQNLRTKSAINALGDSGGLLADGTHLHEGIGPLCAAYANLLVILREAGFENISIIGEKIGLGISTSWISSIGVLNPNPSSSTTVVGITPDNVYLAQVAAIASIKHPFELSFDADGESEKGVTLDDFLG